MPTPLPFLCPPHPFSANLWAAQAEEAGTAMEGLQFGAACRGVLSSQKATANAETASPESPWDKLSLKFCVDQAFQL